jgi:hypothetical protein
MIQNIKIPNFHDFQYVSNFCKIEQLLMNDRTRLMTVGVLDFYLRNSYAA